MSRAVALAGQATTAPRPNPRVGCVLVRDDAVIGEGFHHRAGGPHAEIEAIGAARASTIGATAYVTLEPCDHQGKTGPCSEALIEAGVTRVVIGAPDPNPVAAGGAQRLRAAGIEVDVGVLQRECEQVAEVFFTNVRRQRPLVRLKLAATLDGRTAAVDGTSRWITGREARAEVHRLRALHEAVLIGSGTALADNPSLDVRHVPCDRQPLRVVLDRRMRALPDLRLADTSQQRTAIFTTASSASQGERRFAGNGVEVIGVGDGEDGWLAAVLQELRKRRIYAVFCEPGATLAGALVAADLVDRLDIVLGAKLLGGGRGVLQDIGAGTIGDARLVAIDSARVVGGDLWVSATLPRGE